MTDSKSHIFVTVMRDDDTNTTAFSAYAVDGNGAAIGRQVAALNPTPESHCHFSSAVSAAVSAGSMLVMLAGGRGAAVHGDRRVMDVLRDMELSTGLHGFCYVQAARPVDEEHGWCKEASEKSYMMCAAVYDGVLNSGI